MQLTDKDGNIFGTGGLEITTSTGKPKIPVINTDITIGTTTIVGGVAGRLLFDDAGVVGETGGINWNPTTSTLSLLDSLFYSQAGNSSANTAFSITGTASSNYTIYSSRQFIFNTGQSMYFNTDTDGGSALDRAWYFAGARSGLTGGRTYGALTVDSSGFPSFTLYNNDNGARILLASNATSYFNGGNLLVGTTTDAGFKFDVIGSTRVTSLKTADIFPASASISLWVNSLNAASRFYTAPVHQDGRINFNSIAGGSDQVLIRAWHNGQFGLGTGSSSAGGALTVRGDSLLIGTSGALYFMNGTFGPNNVPYRLAISTNATTAAFYSGVSNNLTNIESTKFEFAATSHTFYTGTTTGNQSNPNQFIPLHLSNLGNVGIGTTSPTSPLFIYTNTSSTTITGNNALILHNNNPSQTVNNLTELFFSDAGQATGTADGLNLGHRYASISGFVTGWNFLNSAGGLNFVTKATTSSSITTKLQIRPNGNIIIQDGGTFTDAGYKLDVNGTGRFTGNVTMSSGTSLTIGNIQLFDDTSGTRVIQTLANQGILLRAGSNSITLANSAGSGIATFSTTGTHIFRPSSISSGGLVFSASGIIPTSTTITFSRIRNDGDKLGVINTEDFAVSGATPINLFIYAGRETVLNNQGNLILAHDGTTTRGNVLVGTSTNVASSKLTVASTTQGFLPPRMSNAQMLAIATPAEGLMVYDTTNNKLCCYDGTTWQNLF